jgi:hypothetical protein
MALRRAADRDEDEGEQNREAHRTYFNALSDATGSGGVGVDSGAFAPIARGLAAALRRQAHPTMLTAARPIAPRLSHRFELGA